VYSTIVSLNCMIAPGHVRVNPLTCNHLHESGSLQVRSVGIIACKLLHLLLLQSLSLIRDLHNCHLQQTASACASCIAAEFPPPRRGKNGHHSVFNRAFAHLRECSRIVLKGCILYPIVKPSIHLSALEAGEEKLKCELRLNLGESGSPAQTAM
jgi:hypothetical protein